MKHPQAWVEHFHLLFLRQLETKLDKKLFALKGGCNLRFYFKSIRYSEDIDLDITTVAKATLEKKVSSLLESIDFQRILSSNGMQIISINPAKQTETTQRWKLQLKVNNLTFPLPTKIEFSRRKMDEGISYDPIDNEVLLPYQLYPILCTHYLGDTALIQKVQALIHRTETQARDIFDLKLLLDRGHSFSSHLFTDTDRSAAINNVMSIDFPSFKSQVVAFLMEQYQSYYDDKNNWESICDFVIAALEK